MPHNLKLYKEKARKDEGKNSKLSSFQSMGHFRKAAGQLSDCNIGSGLASFDPYLIFDLKIVKKIILII